MQFAQAVSTSQPVYQTPLVVVCGGNVYIGQPNPANTIAIAGNMSGHELQAGVNVGMALVNNVVYIVDGVSIRALDLATGAMIDYAATAGTAPTNCLFACNWRGRLVLAGDSANPQNFYMARAGTATDWDYSQTDAAAAVAGNLSKSGQIGEPITTLIPYTDDNMMISCSHSLWMLEGDPADGGTIVPVSQSLGIVGPQAWCIDPQGMLYFVATGGLYHVKPMWETYQPPELMSGNNYDQFFQSLGWGGSFVNLIWDADLHYLYIFATPTDGVTQATHLVFDARNGGLWPQSFPVTQGPTVATVYLSDAQPANRAIVLGGWDGYVRRLNTAARDDDGTAISASITFGPYKPFPEAALLTGTTIDFGEVATSDEGASPTKWNAVATLHAGPDAYEVTQGTAHSTFAVPCTLERRQKTFRQRLRGGWFTLQVTNSVIDTYFSFESALLEFVGSGRNRERR